MAETTMAKIARLVSRDPEVEIERLKASKAEAAREEAIERERHEARNDPRQTSLLP